jgi:hypothetical protein
MISYMLMILPLSILVVSTRMVKPLNGTTMEVEFGAIAGTVMMM